MKFTLDWLYDHWQSDVNLEVIIERLNMIGLEVKSYFNPLEEFNDFIIAKVIDCIQHPHVEHTRICQVDIGKREVVQILCNAPNVRNGLVSVFTHQINKHITNDFSSVSLQKIININQDQNYSGKLCSEHELRISNQQDKIIELPDSSPVGELFVRYKKLDDPIIDISLTPNRGDAASVRGIARDLVASGLGTLKSFMPPISIQASNIKSLKWNIDKNALNYCPQIMGRTFEITSNSASPEWMRRRLIAVGLRPISALVDITNYITYDIGRPLHIFDANKIQGKYLHVHLAKGGEKLRALNGHHYSLNTNDILISDKQGIVALGGIIGGESTSVDVCTRRIFLECATFKASSIASTGRRLSINSDAQFRFERTVDPCSLQDGINYASHLIVECCGGKNVQASETVEAGAPPIPTPTIILTLDMLSRYTGIKMSAKQAAALLIRLGAQVSHYKDYLKVIPPSYRSDIVADICLVEEILRLYGYNFLPAISLPQQVLSSKKPLIKPEQRRISLIRRALAHQGLNENISITFCDDRLGKAFANNQSLVKIANPIGAEMSLLRPTPLCGLMQSAIKNFRHYRSSIALFQIGPGWYANNSVNQQIEYACGLRLGPVMNWMIHNNSRQYGNGGNDPFMVKGDILEIMELCGIKNPTLRRDCPTHYHPNRSGGFYLNNIPIAYFGNLHPDIIMQADLKLSKGSSIAIFEILLDNLPSAICSTKINKEQFVKYPLQPLYRNFSFIVPANYLAGELLQLIQSIDKQLICDVHLLDKFDCHNDQTTKRIVTYRVTIQPQGSNLTESDIQALCQKIVDQVLCTSPATLN